MYRFALMSLFVFSCAAEDESLSSPPPSSVDYYSDDDDDGFTLAEERAAGTNPDYKYSHPYAGNYNVGFCDTPPEPTGSTGSSHGLINGDVPHNITFPDQFGEQVDLYSFCGKKIMVLVSAGWCGPCRSAAEDLQEMQNTYRDQGLQIIEMITANNSYQPPNAPNQAFVEDWADQYGFEDIPVLAIPAYNSTDHVDPDTGKITHPGALFDLDGYIPSIYHLNEKMEVVSADEGIHDPAQFL